jgi:hypothetical protein
MEFTVRSITADDLAKINSSIEHSPAHGGETINLRYRINLDRLCKHKICSSTSRNNLLINLPSHPFESSFLYAYFREKSFCIIKLHSYCKLEYLFIAKELIELLPIIEHEMREAFKVYGLWGDGVSDPADVCSMPFVSFIPPI